MDKHRQSYHDKFSELKAPINKSALWDNIASDPTFPVKRKSKRRIFWFWFTGFAVILIGFLMVWSILPMDDNKGEVTNETSTPINEILNIQNRQTIDTTENVASVKTIHSVLENEDSILNKTASKKIKSESNRMENIDMDVYNSNVKWIQKSSSLLATEHSKKPNFDPSRRIQKTTDNTAKQSNNHQETNAPPLEIQKENRGLGKSTNVEPVPNNQMTNIPSLQAEGAFLEHNFFPRMEPYLLSQTIKHWTISLAMGVGYHLRTFDIINNDVQNNTPNLRKANTRALESYIINLGMDRNLRRNWSIGVGVQLARNYEKYIYHNNKTIYLLNGLSDVGFYNEEETKTTYHHYHQIQQLDVKLQISKYWQFRKWKVSISPGILYNVHFIVSGDLTNEQLTPFSIVTSEYKSNLDIRFFGLMSIERRMTQGSVFTSIQIENPYDLTQEMTDFKHQIMPIYWMIGYKMHL